MCTCTVWLGCPIVICTNHNLTEASGGRGKLGGEVEGAVAQMCGGALWRSVWGTVCLGWLCGRLLPSSMGEAVFHSCLASLISDPFI